MDVRILPNNSPCEKETGPLIKYQLIAMIISGAIIAILCILEKRSEHTRCKALWRRPAVIYPINMLDHCSDNFGYMMSFGSIAGYCYVLFNIRGLLSAGPAWYQTLLIMLYVLVIGFMFYPLFACLTTSWVFVGSILGLGYCTFWLYVHFMLVINCPNGGENGLTGQEIAKQLPVLVCTIGLAFRYLYVLIRNSIRAIKARSAGPFIERVERRKYGTPYNIQYVKNLLAGKKSYQNMSYAALDGEPNWKTKIRALLRQYIYVNDPTFKYSPRIIGIFTVALICSYQFGIIIVLGSYQLEKLVKILYPNTTAEGNSTVDDSGYSFLRLMVNTVNVSALLSFILSSLLTLFSIFQILTNYRHNIKLMFKGIFNHLPFDRDDRNAVFVLSDSMAYAGSQIAYILWGYIIVWAVLLLTFFALAYLIVLPVFGLISRDVLKYMWNLLSGVLIFYAFTLLQKLFCRGLLQTRISVDSQGKQDTSVILALDNRKIFHNVTYFTFFFYIVLGLFGCLLTIIKGMILGIMYLSRLDKCGLVNGFETWDKGYMNYVSFLHFEECHRHPVLLVFCDILIDGMPHDRNQARLNTYGTVDDVSTDVTYSSSWTALGRPRRRWLKAYTMVRNSSVRAKQIEADYDTLEDIDITDLSDQAIIDVSNNDLPNTGVAHHDQTVMHMDHNDKSVLV
ncbi:stimulated by retinoic acid gene 6 protein-like isoform X2 [Dreissena polymorpha]|uniref:stimulated by retinoic acid gene 6 protein-like isoform X2 n=1 Tax=Dreissena polymorpha TaxID=45954 RepID=UPI002263CB78|nr:stimulated by retinoic acid gene 6 protein-like isoform X2 [Dreissena polymorpha]